MFDDDEYTVTIGGYQVCVNKCGGGTVGRLYIGDWEVTVLDGDVCIMDNELLFTGTSKTHRAVAFMAFKFASEGES